jgi:hypothetical protein
MNRYQYYYFFQRFEMCMNYYLELITFSEPEAVSSDDKLSTDNKLSLHLASILRWGRFANFSLYNAFSLSNSCRMASRSAWRTEGDLLILYKLYNFQQ